MTFSKIFRNLTVGTLIVGQTSAVLAQASGNSIRPEAVRSIIYSESERKAIVATVEENGLGRFIECDTPTKISSGKIRMADFVSCVDIPHTSYIANEDMINTINTNFSNRLENNFQKIQMEQSKDDGSDKSTNIADLLAPGFLMAFTGTMAYMAYKAPWSSVGIHRPARLAHAAVWTGIFLVALHTVVWKIAGYEDAVSQPLTPLEDNVKTTIATMSKKSGNSRNTPAMDSAQSNRQINSWSKIYYQAFRQSVIDAVAMSHNL